MFVTDIEYDVWKKSLKTAETVTLIMVTIILAVYDAKKITVEHMGQEIETSKNK